MERFRTYHPYLTYSNANNECFVKVEGEQVKELDEDTTELFSIGREAYNRLPKARSKDDFDTAFHSYFKFIDEWRDIFRQAHRDGKLKPRSPNGEELNPDWNEVESHQILGIAWKLCSPSFETISHEGKDDFRGAYLCHALKEIDNALIALDLGFSGAVIAAIEASNALSNAVSIESGDENLQKARREMAYQAATARHVGTHAKRQQVKEYWREHIYPGNPKMSNEKAAEWLKDTFPELSFRKLSEYVAQAKREAQEIPPASKA